MLMTYCVLVSLPCKNHWPNSFSMRWAIVPISNCACMYCMHSWGTTYCIFSWQLLRMMLPDMFDTWVENRRSFRYNNDICVVDEYCLLIKVEIRWTSCREWDIRNWWRTSFYVFQIHSLFLLMFTSVPSWIYL